MSTLVLSACRRRAPLMMLAGAAMLVFISRLRFSFLAGKLLMVVYVVRPRSWLLTVCRLPLERPVRPVSRLSAVTVDKLLSINPATRDRKSQRTPLPLPRSQLPSWPLPGAPEHLANCTPIALARLCTPECRETPISLRVLVFGTTSSGSVPSPPQVLPHRPEPR